MKKRRYELIAVEYCLVELIYGAGESVHVNGKFLSDEEYAEIITGEHIAGLL